MGRNLNGVFEKMVDDMCALSAKGELLDSCMELNEEAMRHIPLRYRIIAMGFVKRFTLEELNAKLAQYGCLRLYLRNFWEATLIFAFQNGYSYQEWKAVQAQCMDIYASLEGSAWFRDKKISFGELERYVTQNSASAGDALATQQRTQYLERELRGAANSVEALRGFLVENLQAFSFVREKTRYYFCKYLYYYLSAQIERYFEAVRTRRGVDAALSALLPLKVVTLLRRNQRMPEEEKRARIRESALSCGEIFDEFSYFYFDYVSLDWVEILMECYQSVDDIPEAQKSRIAEALRRGKPELKKLSDADVISRQMLEIEASEDLAYARDGSRGYGRNRSGEQAVYRYIQGTLDIDRTALICFLLFFGSGARLQESQRLDRRRMDEILLSSGYAILDLESDFDWFVVEFLESKRPLEFLSSVMNDYARRNENSFLYHLYNNSIRYEDELLRIMIQGQRQNRRA